jgi:hypothetical protein
MPCPLKVILDSDQDREMMTKIMSSSLTHDEIKEYLQDLKVLGKKVLLKQSQYQMEGFYASFTWPSP